MTDEECAAVLHRFFQFPVSSPDDVRAAIERAVEALTDDPNLPRVAIDADGFWWRDYEGEVWSMVPSTPNNDPVARPVKRYRLVVLDD